MMCTDGIQAIPEIRFIRTTISQNRVFLRRFPVEVLLSQLLRALCRALHRSGPTRSHIRSEIVHDKVHDIVGLVAAMPRY